MAGEDSDEVTIVIGGGVTDKLEQDDETSTTSIRSSSETGSSETGADLG